MHLYKIQLHSDFKGEFYNPSNEDYILTSHAELLSQSQLQEFVDKAKQEIGCAALYLLPKYLQKYGFEDITTAYLNE